MDELIERIVELDHFKIGDNHYSAFEGYAIHTNKQTISLGISNSSGCCESWGYFMSNDDILDFVGSKLLDIKLVDTCLNVSKLEENGANSRDAGGIMFVNLETDRGTLQFTAYNRQNGYYGHEAVVVSEQLNYSEGL